MYRVQRMSDETWAVIGQDGQVVFEGTMRNCEDWLDRQENVDRLSRRVSWWARLLGYFRRSVTRQSGVSDTDSGAATKSSEESKSTPAA